MSKPYIDNNAFTTALATWSASKRQALANTQVPPAMPDDVAQGVLAIATRLSQATNFKGYTYTDEMIGDALLAVVKYGHNFDIKKKRATGSVG